MRPTDNEVEIKSPEEVDYEKLEHESCEDQIEQGGIGDMKIFHEHESCEDQIERLARFIMDEIPGEPSRSEGAVDTAIRLLRKHGGYWERL